jgi:hypothetical protein
MVKVYISSHRILSSVGWALPTIGGFRKAQPYLRIFQKSNISPIVQFFSLYKITFKL